jgi:hypothetical protein
VGDVAAQQAAQQGLNAVGDVAAQQAAQQGLMAGDESLGLLGANYAAPVSDLSLNTVPVADKSMQAGLLDKGKFQLGKLAGGSTNAGGKGGSLATQMGLKMMMPQQQPQQTPMMRPQQGPQEPLHSPYGNPYGTSSGNSTGLPPMDEETRRKLRAMGYRV